jgi:hypothetical protein
MWWLTLAIELIKILPDIIKAIHRDPQENKKSVKKVVGDLRGVVGESPDLKNI